MKQTTLIAIAAALTAIAAELDPNSTAATESGAGEGLTDAPKPRRGRPPASGGSETATGPTEAERFEANRALIKPLVEGGQGEDVKKVIAQYSKTGLKDLPADKQAQFEKDIAALSY